MSPVESAIAALGVPDSNVVIKFRRYDKHDHISISPNTLVARNRQGDTLTFDIYRGDCEELRIVNMLKFGKEYDPDTIREDYTVKEIRELLKVMSFERYDFCRGGFPGNKKGY